MWLAENLSRTQKKNPKKIAEGGREGGGMLTGLKYFLIYSSCFMIYKAFTLSIFRKQKLKSKLSYKKPLKKLAVDEMSEQRKIQP